MPESARGALAVLAASSATGSIGLAAGGTAGALLGVELAGTDAAAGLPLGLLVLGSAGSALLISRQSNRVGRGRSLALGYVLGSAGAALSLLAAVARSLATLLVGSVLLGSANASVFLTRYAAAEAGGEAAAGLAFLAAALTLGTAARPTQRHAAVALLRRAEALAAPTRRQLLDGARAVPARYGVALLASANFVMVGV